MRARRPASGFTLVEVMVALAVFALIAGAGVAMLAQSVRGDAAAALRLDEAAAADRTVSLLAADAAQAVDRPTRDESGVAHPGFVGDGAAAADGAPFLTLVRLGWANPDAAPRASIQKVAWRLRGGALERVSWPALDGAAPSAAAAMMTGVTAVRLRYRINGAWSDRWDGRGPVALPGMMEVALIRGERQWRLVLPVGGGDG